MVEQKTGEKSADVLIVCMGVSGCGKSSLAQALSTEFNWPMIEADDFHTPESKALMAAGKPLTNSLRQPWFNHIFRHIETQHVGQNIVLAFSGLLKQHRKALRNLGYKTIFLHLVGNPDHLLKRLENRTGHFMSPKLLQSQFDTLDSPDAERDVFSIAIDLSLQQAVARTKSILQFTQGRQL